MHVLIHPDSFFACESINIRNQESMQIHFEESNDTKLTLTTFIIINQVYRKTGTFKRPDSNTP